MEELSSDFNTKACTACTALCWKTVCTNALRESKFWHLNSRRLNTEVGSEDRLTYLYPFVQNFRFLELKLENTFQVAMFVHTHTK